MQNKQTVLNDMMAKYKMRDFVNEVKKDPELFEALVARLKGDKNLLQRFSVRTDFLDNDFCSFHEVLEHLRLSFPEYQWEQDSKTFQMARLVMSIINFVFDKKHKKEFKKMESRKEPVKKEIKKNVNKEVESKKKS